MSPRPTLPPGLLRYQRSIDRNSATGWETFAGHRARLMELTLLTCAMVLVRSNVRAGP